jgi:hypothetical protein
MGMYVGLLLSASHKFIGAVGRSSADFDLVNGTIGAEADFVSERGFTSENFVDKMWKSGMCENLPVRRVAHRVE